MSRSRLVPHRAAVAATAGGRHISLRGRLARFDWIQLAGDLDEQGWVCMPGVLTAGECAATHRLYADDSRFRSTVDMEKHRFGRGQYRYFSYPLPPLVEKLRRELYARLAPIADGWAQRLGGPQRYPQKLRDYVALCHAAGQRRPTPLLLHYGPGDYNCLHQDLYGAMAFPLQVVVALSREGTDYEGGELVLQEQRPRAQSRVSVIRLRRGDAVVFTNRERPVRGKRGDYRVQMRHGVATLKSGERLTLGIIFHDAKG
jgi:uncharacterized protein